MPLVQRFEPPPIDYAALEAAMALARTSGRITYFLETLPVPNGDVTPTGEFENARKRVEALEALLNSEDTADRLLSILNIIGGFMTADSKKLDLAHSGS